MNHNMGNMTFLATRKRVLCKKLLKNRNSMACISCGNIKKRVQRKWLKGLNVLTMLEIMCYTAIYR